MCPKIVLRMRVGGNGHEHGAKVEGKRETKRQADVRRRMTWRRKWREQERGGNRTRGL